jgi:hypothetical protein
MFPAVSIPIAVPSEAASSDWKRCDSRDDAIENLLGGFEVALHQDGRGVESFAVGVKACAACAIDGEEFGDIEIDAEEIADRVVIFAAVQAANGDGSGKVAAGAGSGAEVFVDPLNHAQALVFGETGLGCWHRAVAELGGYVTPETAVSFDGFGAGVFEKVGAIFRVACDVAHRAVVDEDGADGFCEFVGCGWSGGWLLGERGGGQGQEECSGEHEMAGCWLLRQIRGRSCALTG